METEDDGTGLAFANVGEVVYDGDGQVLGRISGVLEDGFEVEQLNDRNPNALDQEELPGQEFGEGYLMWQCIECGEMGDLDGGLPEYCPNCGAPRESVTKVLED